MRRLPERLPKISEEVIGRQAGHASHLVNRDRLIERSGDEFLRAMKPPVKLFPGRGAGRGQGFDLPIDPAVNLQQPPRQFMKLLLDPDLVVFSILQFRFEAKQRWREYVVVRIGLLEEADRLHSRRLRVVKQFYDRSGQAVINAFRKPVLEEDAERFDGFLRIDGD